MTISSADLCDEMAIPWAPWGFSESSDTGSLLLSDDNLLEYQVFFDAAHSEQGTHGNSFWGVRLSERDSAYFTVVSGFEAYNSAAIWAQVHARTAKLSKYPALRANWTLHRWREACELNEYSAEFLRVQADLSGWT